MIYLRPVDYSISYQKGVYICQLRGVSEKK